MEISSFCPWQFSGSQQNLQDTFLPRTFHRMHASRKRILLADQAINVDSAFLQEVQRRWETAASRTHDANLVNHKPRLINLVDLAWSLKSRLQHQRPARAQEIQRSDEARR